MSHDRDRRRMLLAGVGAVGAMAVARTARAATCGDSGPLAPTGPTMRTLSDKIARTDNGFAEARIPITSLPGSATAQYVISQPGVYYMTGNITGEAGKNCIEVDADNVEIECDGHNFIGVAGTRNCICTPAPHACVGVYDGGFVGWQGVSCELSSSTDCYIEECWFHECDASSSALGPFCCILGAGGTIDDCNVLSCIGGTLHVGANGIIEECSILDSTAGCLSATGPATIEDNFVQNNPATAIRVIGSGVVLSNRLVMTGGIEVGDNSVVSENDIVGGSGITTGQRCTVEENHVSSTTTGISVGAMSTVEENHLASCDSGIVVASRVSVYANHLSTCPSGISVPAGASSVLVESNNVAGALGTAISVQGSNCLVICNTVSAAATGYDIAAGNAHGAVLDVAGVGELSNTGVTPDAWTNFLY